MAHVHFNSLQKNEMPSEKIGKRKDASKDSIMDGATQFYLGCLIFGFLFSSVSFLMGYSHSLHLPFGHGHGFHAGHGGHALPSGHGLHAPHGAGAHHGTLKGFKGMKPGTKESTITPFNSLTATAFITFFGAAGTLIHVYLGLPPIPTDILALVSGFAGGGTVFWGMSKFVAIADKPMNPLVYDLPGTVARVSATIPQGGTGEIFFTKEGSSFTKAAKSTLGVEIPKGTEVVITKFENGIAWVEPSQKFLNELKKEGG
jgi:membrane protein implicated in regulation of membrane protease activity